MSILLLIFFSFSAFGSDRWEEGNIIYLPGNVIELNAHYQEMRKKYEEMTLEGILLDLKKRETERSEYLEKQDAELKKYFEKHSPVSFFEKMKKDEILEYIGSRKMKVKKKRNELTVSWMKYSPSESLLLPENYFRKLIRCIKTQSCKSYRSNDNPADYYPVTD